MKSWIILHKIHGYWVHRANLPLYWRLGIALRLGNQHDCSRGLLESLRRTFLCLEASDWGCAVIEVHINWYFYRANLPLYWRLGIALRLGNQHDSSRGLLLESLRRTFLCLEVSGWGSIFMENNIVVMIVSRRLLTVWVWAFIVYFIILFNSINYSHH